MEQTITIHHEIETPENYQQLANLTNINEIIAQIQPLQRKSNYQSYVNLMKSIFQLSSYLFKKHQVQESFNQSFEEYLVSVEGMRSPRKQEKFFDEQCQPIQNLKKEKKRKKNFPDLPGVSLVKCYQQVPFIFFQNNFVLNFNSLSKQQNTHQTINQLNDQLDLVEINLFAQIHHKFQEYFEVVTNLDYLKDSITKSIKNVANCKSTIKKCQRQFVEKSITLRKYIIKRQNIQKILKSLRIIKSLQKLPIIIDGILKSSLPYQCLSLLETTKQSLKIVNGLPCIEKIELVLKNCQGTIQMSLSKRYTDELYLYLLGDYENMNFHDKWNKISLNKCLDISMNMSGYADGDASAILEESFCDADLSNICGTFNLKRFQAKQYQISILLLQSYKFIDFPIEQGRVKICNFLRIFSKMYERDMAVYFQQIIIKNQQQKQSDNLNGQKIEEVPQTIKQKTQDNSDLTLNQEIVSNLTVDFYVKHIRVLNQAFRQILNRYLGYINTLISQYDQQVSKNLIDQIYQQKFSKIFDEQFSLFPTIYKLMTQKIKSLLVLKNLSGTPYIQFSQWVNTLTFWQKNFQAIVDQHPLSSYSGPLAEIISNNFKKTSSIIGQLKVTIHQLTINYINLYHENVLYNQMKPALEDQCWQSVQIPRQFQQVVLGIISSKDHKDFSSASLTILNDSSFKPKQETMKIKNQGQNNQLKIKLLKNTLLLEGHRYKITVSLLLICQYIEQYLKMSRLFSNESYYLIEKLTQLINYYNKMSNQLIIAQKALKFEKIKTKTITVKHICLLSNCLTVLYKLVTNIPIITDYRLISQPLLQHKNELHKKLSSILLQKIKQIIKQQLVPNTKISITQTNSLISTTYLQMFQIVDDYLDNQTCKNIFKDSIQYFMQKYFIYLLTKDQQVQNQIKILVNKLKFMRIYFIEEFQEMEKQLQK